MLVPTLLRNYFEGHLGKKRTDSPRVAKIAIVRLNSHFKRKHLADITQADVDAYCETRKPNAPATTRRELSVLIAAAHWNVRARNIAATEIPLIDLPPASPTKDVWLTREQAMRLLAAAARLDHDQTCPHGRPTRVRFGLADLERAFHRR